MTKTVVEWPASHLISRRMEAKASKERSRRDPTPHLLNENVPILFAVVSSASLIERPVTVGSINVSCLCRVPVTDARSG